MTATQTLLASATTTNLTSSLRQTGSSRIPAPAGQAGCRPCSQHRRKHHLCGTTGSCSYQEVCGKAGSVVGRQIRHPIWTLALPQRTQALHGLAEHTEDINQWVGHRLHREPTG